MKRIIKIASIFAILNLSIGLSAKANTIITAPLDSRPVSIEYLQNLSDLGGDNFVMPEKEHLDIFSDYNVQNNKFANSKKVREEIKGNVSKNNKENTTVIINTSSYITGGLIGSRSSKNYSDYELALEELKYLTNNYNNPYYYVNSMMPRTLPEDRNNSIWPNSSKIDGLGTFFVKYYPNDSIQKTFSKVTPSQLLMEWSYVQNKKNEGYKLEKWEQEFLSYFESSYLNNKIYSSYIDNYKSIFEKSSNITKALIDMVYNGDLNELVISIDDFQLPTFISHLVKTNKVDTSWIPKENGNAIKFSWARTYLKTGTNSIQNYHLSVFGNEEFNKSLNATSQTINYIYGVDEVPQMIYARDLTKRNQLSSNIELIYDYNLDVNASKNDMGMYDSMTLEQTANNALNFINVNYDKKVNKPFKIYINKYLETKSNINESKMNSLIKDMFSNYNKGSNVGLFEFYSMDVINNGSNELFQKLSNREYLESLGLKDNSIAQLSTYSSWNTVGNTLGLGLAHAQVFSIAEEINEDKKEVAINNSTILAQHLLEDGVYAGQLKHLFNKDKYDLSSYNSQTLESTLLNELNKSQVMDNFVDCEVDIDGESITINEAKIDSAGFPWLRKFDCFIQISFE